MDYSGTVIDLSINNFGVWDDAIKMNKKLNMAKPCSSLYLKGFCDRTL